MGQYFYIVNPAKKEYLHPHKFDEGLKLAEFGSSSEGSLKALAWLLADNGDHPWPHPMMSHWVGDPIVVAGDYGPRDQELNGDKVSLHKLASETFEDISEKCLSICDL
jgi:hypothetical protein